MRGKIVSAAELERMSPAEQDAIFEQSIVRDPENDPRVPARFLADVRSRLQARIAVQETSDPS
jgi:hypothetical protein